MQSGDFVGRENKSIENMLSITLSNGKEIRLGRNTARLVMEGKIPEEKALLIPEILPRIAEKHRLLQKYITEKYSLSEDCRLIVDKASHYGNVFNSENLKDDLVTVIRDFNFNEQTLASLMGLKQQDPGTFKHMILTSLLSIKMAKDLGYHQDDLVEIGMGALLHDIGKYLVEDYLIKKEGVYDKKERCMMKKHPEIGYAVLLDSCMGFIKDTVLEMVLGHHEKLNGSGYPHGLKGDQISKPTRILTVADIYDALVSDRPYRRAFNIRSALNMMIWDAKKGEIDNNLVDMLISYHRRDGTNPVDTFYYGSSSNIRVH